ncbi:MAG: DUF2802 domain-containing protein, partial [Solirubrobacterales bacterium]|nr:DUF2802 domain-containing protein [Solirubrobacterales bacterium]
HLESGAPVPGLASSRAPAPRGAPSASAGAAVRRESTAAPFDIERELSSAHAA